MDGRAQPIEAVFLDAGGTLLRENPSRAEIYRQCAAEHGLHVDLETMRAAMRTAHAALPREIDGHFRYSEGWFGHFMEHALVLQLGLDRRQLAGVRARILSRFADAATFELYPGAQELLRALATRRTIVGVISNWSEPLERILAGLGISGELDFVLASAVERCEKPERAIFERALSRAGVAPERAVHCGDDLDRDVRGARALGILPVLLDRRGEHRAAECERVEDLPQFQRWLHRRTSTT